jgi:predicted glutamine amidotransferase
MCRLYGCLSNEPTKVDCSLVYAQNALMQQSRVDESGLDHTDGWGIVTYLNGVPHLIKKTTAAYEDQSFSRTAEQSYSTAIVAHIRKATVGRNSISNTHPFVVDRWTFAHNGTLAGFDKICGKLEKETRPELQSRRSGQTDSEQYFLWLLSRAQLATDSGLPADQVTEIAEALRHSVGQLANWCQAAASDEPPRLNFVLTDGESMLACRWNHSLFTIRREGMYECEICGIPHVHHHQTENHRSVAFASEPVTHEKWEEVANQSIVAFNLGIASPTC